MTPKKTARYYLAHPIRIRHMVRQQELVFEKSTGIELLNPFYDGAEASAIAPLDRGEITMKQYSDRLAKTGQADAFVESDLKNIQEADGVVAVIPGDVPTIGTSMEMWHAYTIRKPVFIITDFPGHIWLRYVAEKSGGAIVSSFEQLAPKLQRMRRQK